MAARLWPTYRLAYVWTALSDRRGVPWTFLWAYDPWYHKWLSQTRGVMRRYRQRVEQSPTRGLTGLS